MAAPEHDTPEHARLETDELQEGLQEGLFSHLIELRSRLMKAVIAVVVVLLALMPFANRLYAELAAPLVARLPQGAHLIATEVASPFVTPLKLAFYTALFISMPVILYQLWAFVSPGLYKHEKRLARPLLVAAVLLFYIGCAFAYFLVLPAAFRFLVAVTPEGVEMMTDITHYLDFVMLMFFAFGLCFEVPVAVVILAAIGVVSIDQLRNGRRYAIVGAFVIAAFITPPDITSMIMLAIPMCLLYEVGVLAVRWLVRPRDETTSS
ncbi:twin-arginine translocase subunit TatC [Dyella tabacisoli]|uniref:Sec-independent protein translocase protein TatC n=1 Tax=Dyella tabacisoli TaxID=2282381 RepID=A0A369UKC6_9GAMM|nr:twin-arginine translocase subunit TatC [Dyella tabacisoli]RDD80773.1 twin-arginine translocase subunit TatC [Dyella tabacisoli]